MSPCILRSEGAEDALSISIINSEAVFGPRRLLIEVSVYISYPNREWRNTDEDGKSNPVSGCSNPSRAVGLGPGIPEVRTRRGLLVRAIQPERPIHSGAQLEWRRRFDHD